VQKSRKSRKKQEVVLISNWIYKTNIASILTTPNELDVFCSVAYQAKGRGQEDVAIPYSWFLKHVGFKGVYAKELHRMLGLLSERVLKPEWLLPKSEDSQPAAAALFDKFAADIETKTLTVRVSGRGAAMFSNAVHGGSYTRFELSEFVSVRGYHSKLLYFWLKKWGGTGKVMWALDDIQRWLKVKKSCERRMDETVLRPAINELSGKFPGLSCSKERSGNDARKIACIQFTFGKRAKSSLPSAKETAQGVFGGGQGHRYQAEFSDEEYYALFGVPRKQVGVW
jgi:hypothetical protein